MDLNREVGVPPYPPLPFVTRRHDMRHKKTRSQNEVRRVPGYQEAGNTPLHVKHSMQTIAYFKKQFFVLFVGAPGFLFTVTLTVSDTFLVADSDAA